MKKTAVLGAGIIGICCAIELRRKGLDVTLFDECPPGEKTSSGNAGVICTAGIAPYASPTILPQLPAYATNTNPSFKFHWPHFLPLLPWTTQFIFNCNWTRYKQCLTSLSYISNDAVKLHKGLLQEANTFNLFRDRGWLKLYRTNEDFATSKRERENYDQHNVSTTILDRDDIQALEPVITRHYSKGILLDGSPFVTNPKSVCESYFNLFMTRGGKFQQDRILELLPQESNWKITTPKCSHQFDNVVLALGADSLPFLSELKIKVPLAIERGYHLAFSMREMSTLSRSIIDTQKGLVMTPMNIGDEALIRVTSAVNLIARKTSPRYSQILDLLPEMKTILPLGEQKLDEPWVGHRPSTPDSIPVIGPAPDNPGLWLAFGHGHLGLTLGPKTGKLIASSISGEKIDLEAKAFSATRFL